MTHYLLDMACIDDGFTMDNDSKCKWHQILKLMMEEKIDEPTSREQIVFTNDGKNQVLC